MTRGPGDAGAPGPLARLVDHTALDPATTGADVDRLCREAVDMGFAAVCVNPCHVERAAAALEGEEPAAATVVSFPLGQHPPAAKAREAREAVEAGAEELDMVVNLGAVREGRWDVLASEVGAVAEAAGEGVLVKAILETAALPPREVVRAAREAAGAGADVLKTSTGFHPAGGATPDAVALLRMAGGTAVGVKAAGGIRTCEQALRMVAAGATRIGTSSGLELAACRDPLPPSLTEDLGGGRRP